VARTICITYNDNINNVNSFQLLFNSCLIVDGELVHKDFEKSHNEQKIDNDFNYAFSNVLLKSLKFNR